MVPSEVSLRSLQLRLEYPSFSSGGSLSMSVRREMEELVECGRQALSEHLRRCPGINHVSIDV